MRNSDGYFRFHSNEKFLRSRYRNPNERARWWRIRVVRATGTEEVSDRLAEYGAYRRLVVYREESSLGHVSRGCAPDRQARTNVGKCVPRRFGQGVSEEL